MSTESDTYCDPAEHPIPPNYVEYDQPYRRVSRLAVVSLVMVVFSLSAFLFPALAVLPLVGVLAGVLSLWGIRRYPRELTGTIPACIGITICGGLFIGSTAMHTAIYLTEVPDGYQRISFADLQPDEKHRELPVSERALELNGQRVFVKGYVYPGEKKSNLKKFVLVRDLGTCCFGGQPKPTHMIDITLDDPHRVDYNTGIRRLGGILKVDTRPKKVGDLGGVYFQLEADYVR